MAQYKCVPFGKVEYTELARNSYLEYERSKDDPDEAEIETAWTAKRKMLRDALNTLTPRQREVYVLKIGYQLTEAEISRKLHIDQSGVSRHLKAAERKLRNYNVNVTD